MGSWVWCVFRGLLCPLGLCWVSLGDCGPSCGLRGGRVWGWVWVWEPGCGWGPGLCRVLHWAPCRLALVWEKLFLPFFSLCLEGKGRMEGPPVPMVLACPGLRLATLQVGKLLDQPCGCRLRPMVGLVFWCPGASMDTVLGGEGGAAGPCRLGAHIYAGCWAACGSGSLGGGLGDAVPFLTL